MKTLIVDDEPIARARLRALCGKLAGPVEVVGEAANGWDALDRIAQAAPDLVLLDIAMPDLDGMGVAAALARLQAPPAVIFCTAHSDHALEAFAVRAIDYLLKPVGLDRLAAAIDRAVQWRNGATAPASVPGAWLYEVWVPHGDAMIRIAMSDVERVEAEGDYVRLVTPGSTHLLHQSLAGLAERLDPARFVRVRRSAIVRVDLIRAVEHIGGGAWNVRLADDMIVRAGPTYWKALKERLRTSSEGSR